jgi:hypothetical protein
MIEKNPHNGGNVRPQPEFLENFSYDLRCEQTRLHAFPIALRDFQTGKIEI